MRSREWSTELESALAYPGWRVVGASVFGVMLGYAVLVPYTFSLFIKPLRAAFGWRRDQISLALTCVALTVATCSALIGWLIDRAGPRRVIVGCSLTFGLAFASLAFLGPHIAQLYVVYVVLGLAGNGTTQLAYSRAVCTWFEHKRGLALSLVSAGAGAGSMMLPLATAGMIGRQGWRAAYGLLGAAVIVVSVPLAFLLVRDRDDRASKPEQPTRSESGALSSARPFILLILAIFLYSISFNAIISHLAPLLTDRGLGIREAAAALSLLGVCGLTGRILIGYVIDRAFAARVSMLLFLLTIAALMLIAPGSRVEAFTGVALLGFAAGGESDITPYLLSRYYSLGRFSFLYGCAWTAFAAGTAVGPYIMGVLYTHAGSYQARGIQFLALPTLVSGVLMLFMPRYSAVAPRNSHLIESAVLAGDPIASDS